MRAAQSVKVLLAAALIYAAPVRAQAPVDLELVLAVDISSSVSTDEYNLQMGGLADAFRNPAIGAAILAAGDLGIAVALVQWSDNRRQFISVPWTRLHDRASLHRFADAISQATRLVIAGGGTAIGGALKFSTAQIEENAYFGRRRVIDVSGDGRTNQGRPDRPLRDAAVARGITINGLVILNEEPQLDRYYQDHVIGGPGAFVMTTMDFQTYARAILAKLVREIAGPPVAALSAFPMGRQ